MNGKLTGRVSAGDADDDDAQRARVGAGGSGVAAPRLCDSASRLVAPWPRACSAGSYLEAPLRLERRLSNETISEPGHSGAPLASQWLTCSVVKVGAHVCPDFIAYTTHVCPHHRRALCLDSGGVTTGIRALCPLSQIMGSVRARWYRRVFYGKCRGMKHVRQQRSAA
jgi:hypothetical protein